jgi:hypothetical protein
MIVSKFSAARRDFDHLGGPGMQQAPKWLPPQNARDRILPGVSFSLKDSTGILPSQNGKKSPLLPSILGKRSTGIDAKIGLSEHRARSATGRSACPCPARGL